MPNYSKGGISAQARRRDRRAHLSVPGLQVSEDLTTITIPFYSRCDLTQNTWSKEWGMHVLAFGNEQLFSGPYEKLRFYEEFLIQDAQFKCTHEVIRTAQWRRDVHSDIATFHAATFIRDYDAEIRTATLINVDWNKLCKHSGIENVVITTGASKVTHQVWTPSESTEPTWRRTNTDGSCHLYILAHELDKDEGSPFTSYGYSISTIVRAEITLHLCGRNILLKNSSQPVVLLPNTSSTSRSQLPSPTYDGQGFDFRLVSSGTVESACTSTVKESVYPEAEKFLDDAFNDLAK